MKQIHRNELIDTFLGKYVKVSFKFGWPEEEGELHYNEMRGLYELHRPGRSYAFRKTYVYKIEEILERKGGR